MEDQVHDAQNSDDMLKRKIRKAGDWILISIFMILFNIGTIKSGTGVAPLIQNVCIAWITANIGFLIFEIIDVKRI